MCAALYKQQSPRTKRRLHLIAQNKKGPRSRVSLSSRILSDSCPFVVLKEFLFVIYGGKSTSFFLITYQF